MKNINTNIDTVYIEGKPFHISLTDTYLILEQNPETNDTNFIPRIFTDREEALRYFASHKKLLKAQDIEDPIKLFVIKAQEITSLINV